MLFTFATLVSTDSVPMLRIFSSNNTSQAEERDLCLRLNFLVAADNRVKVDSAHVPPSSSSLFLCVFHRAKCGLHLLPFINSSDQLTLSMACKHLHYYRHHLRKLHLHLHPKPHPGCWNDLRQLLIHQQPGAVEEVKINDLPLVMALDMAPKLLESIISLDLSSLNIGMTGTMRGLTEVLSLSGCLYRLHRLNLGFNAISAEELRMMLDKLVAGPPHLPLTHLILNTNFSEEDTGHLFCCSLSRLMESRCVPRLQELDLSENAIGDGMLKFSQAMQHCPSLEKLGLGDCGMTNAGGRAIGAALSHLGNLKELDVGSHLWLEDEGLVPMFKSLKLGSCPRLTHLLLDGVDMNAPATRELQQVLESGHLSSIQVLNLNRALKDRETCFDFLQSLAAVDLPDLQFLDLQDNNLTLRHAQVIEDAITQKAWPNLQTLHLSKNPVIGKEGIDNILNVLKDRKRQLSS